MRCQRIAVDPETYLVTADGEQLRIAPPSVSLPLGATRYFSSQPYTGSGIRSDRTRGQLADSAFPTGGFAHSWGLEAAWQAGELDAGSLPPLLRQLLWQTAYGTLPIVTAAYDHPTGWKPSTRVRRHF